MPTETKIKPKQKKLKQGNSDAKSEQIDLLDLTVKKLRNFNKKTKHVVGNEKELYSELANYGWYISGEINFGLYFKVFSLIATKDHTKARALLLKYYRANLVNLSDVLLRKHPNRRQIFLEAFAAHKKKQYFASTILFLSQADGICQGKIFRGKKVFNNYIESTKSTELIRFVLGKESAIDVDTRNPDRANYFSDLNRHGVMHGLHLDYGKEENSLKALSLLCFISDFIESYS